MTYSPYGTGRVARLEFVTVGSGFGDEVVVVGIRTLFRSGPTAHLTTWRTAADSPPRPRAVTGEVRRPVGTVRTRELHGRGLTSDRTSPIRAPGLEGNGPTVESPRTGTDGRRRQPGIDEEASVGRPIPSSRDRLSFGCGPA